MTWIPYKINVDRKEFVHDRTKMPLLPNQVDKYYIPGYQGPKEEIKGFVHSEDHCGSAYFGILKKYRNLYQESCSYKMCTACEIPTSHETIPLLSLKGLCEHSFFDKVQYDAETQIHFVGMGKSVIKFNFLHNVWEIRNVNNAFVKATSSASFSSLAIGTFVWNITNDTRCSSQDSSMPLSLSGCYEDQFSCNNGHCIDIEKR